MSLAQLSHHFGKNPRLPRAVTNVMAGWALRPRSAQELAVTH